MYSEKNDSLGPFLKTQFGEYFLHPVNRTEFVSKRSTERYLEEWGERLFKEDTFYVIVGTDSGNLLRYVSEGPVKKGAQYVFVELEEVLERIPEVCSLQDLPEGVSVVSHSSSLLRALNIFDYFLADNVRMHFSLAVQAGYLPEYRELQWRIQKDLNQMQFEISAKFGNETFFQAQMRNLAENRVQAGVLSGAFKGRTAVMLGAGPSLDEHLPWVLENRDRITLLAVSRVGRRLLEVGLVPDLIFSVDPQEISLTVSQDILEFSDSAILVNAYHASPTLLGQWPGQNLYVGPLFPWQELKQEKSISSRGPTVTHNALEVALQLGFSRVYLIGVDLCLSREGYTHARGSIEREAGARFAADYFQVETYAGGTAEAPPGYLLGINALATQAIEASQNGTRFFNLNLHAAKIPGIDYVPKEEIELDTPEGSVLEIFRKHVPENSISTRKAHCQLVLAELDHIESQLDRMKKLARKALECNARLFGRNKAPADFKFKQQMDSIEKKLNHDFAGLADWVKTYSARDFIRMPRALGGRDWSDEEIEKAGRFYYETYLKSIADLKKLLIASRERVSDRLAEDAEEIDWIRIFERWEMDGQPGRSRVWKARHPHKIPTLPKEITGQLADREKEMCEMLSLKKEGFRADARKGWDITGTREKALSLFQGRNKVLLGNLVDYLDQSSASEIKPYHFLARGYLAELSGEYARALEQYEVLITDETPADILEDALKRILVISLNQRNADNALLALDCLSAISPIYQPKYGEMLRLTGRLEDAIAVYADYLPKVPEDLDAMVSMGRVYCQAGHPEAARLAARNVLDKDAKNQGAMELLLSLGENLEKEQIEQT